MFFQIWVPLNVKTRDFLNAPYFDENSAPVEGVRSSCFESRGRLDPLFRNATVQPNYVWRVSPVTILLPFSVKEAGLKY